MIKKGEIYKHFKGGKYGIIAVARHCDTNEPYAVYKDLESGEVYIRILSDFEAKVQGNIKRFDLIDKVDVSE